MVVEVPFLPGVNNRVWYYGAVLALETNGCLASNVYCVPRVPHKDHSQEVSNTVYQGCRKRIIHTRQKKDQATYFPSISIVRAISTVGIAVLWPGTTWKYAHQPLPFGSFAKLLWGRGGGGGGS